MKIILACRHGEAFKNLKGIYGGRGSYLTQTGVSQVKIFAEKLNKLQKEKHMPIDIYISCLRTHVVESAKIIAQHLGLDGKILTDPNFKPIRLGVFDGMSRENQLRLYPDACKAHELWEKGLLDIKDSEKLVDGMQPAKEYYEQVKKFLTNLEENKIHVLIGTRSDLSCMKNISLGQDPSNHMAYKNYSFDYMECLELKIDKNFAQNKEKGE